MGRSKSRTRRALAPIASPLCAAGTHWLTIMRRLGQGLIDGRAIEPELFQLLRGVELPPEIEGHVRRRGAGRREGAIDEAEQRTREVLRSQPADGGELTVDDPILQLRVRP